MEDEQVPDSSKKFMGSHRLSLKTPNLFNSTQQKSPKIVNSTIQNKFSPSSFRKIKTAKQVNVSKSSKAIFLKNARRI
jgi:hypothetical protein